MYDRKSHHQRLQNPEDLKAIPNAWMQCMRTGAFEEAWKLSEKVLQAGVNRDPRLPRHFQCVWDGTPLVGKRVLVRCYHGLGDTIQFIRYVPLLKKMAKAVIVWAQPPLMDLLRGFPGIDTLLPLHDGAPEVAYDVDVEVMELPFIFRTTLETIPCDVPYFYVEPLQLSAGGGSRTDDGALNSNGEALNVGLVWQAGDWNQSRCIPFSTLAGLDQIEGVNLYVLQANAPVAGWKEGFGIHPGEFNLYDYARVIRGLDLMISADSMPAHLAGAMNVPVWTLLHNQADWRWMDKRTDSPWYPSMRLFRQSDQGDWAAVISSVAEELRKLAVAKQQAS